MSRPGRAAFTFAIPVAIIAAVAVPYFALVREGKVSPPDPAEIELLLNRLGVGIVGSASLAALIGLSIIVILAAIAPIIYAARSGDLITVVVSLVLVVAT